MSAAFVPFLYELRAKKVKVGAQEAMALAKALTMGLHDSSLDGFYHLARAICVHRETDASPAVFMLLPRKRIFICTDMIQICGANRCFQYARIFAAGTQKR